MSAWHDCVVAAHAVTRWRGHHLLKIENGDLEVGLCGVWVKAFCTPKIRQLRRSAYGFRWKLGEHFKRLKITFRIRGIRPGRHACFSTKLWLALGRLQFTWPMVLISELQISLIDFGFLFLPPTLNCTVSSLIYFYHYFVIIINPSLSHFISIRVTNSKCILQIYTFLNNMFLLISISQIHN